VKAKSTRALSANSAKAIAYIAQNALSAKAAAVLPSGE